MRPARFGSAALGLGLLLLAAACTTTSTSTDALSVPDTGEAPDAGPRPNDGGQVPLDADVDGGPVRPSSCRTAEECPPGERCLFWNAGCDQTGTCAAPPFPLDASISCCGICDCDGQWRGNVTTDFPFQRRDFDCEQSCTPPGGGAADEPVCNCPNLPLCAGYDGGT